MYRIESGSIFVAVNLSTIFIYGNEIKQGAPLGIIYPKDGAVIIPSPIAITSTTKALEAAEKSEVVVAVVGERSGLSPIDVTGEGRDSANLRLPGVQEDLLKALHEVGKPLVVVLVNGRPLSLRWVAENSSALIEAWFPGEEGGNAVADVLFGDYNPSGKLPVSFPQEVGQIPVYYCRRPSSFRDYVFTKGSPLFPFGHGLSYTRFEYSDLKVEPERIVLLVRMISASPALSIICSGAVRG